MRRIIGVPVAPGVEFGGSLPVLIMGPCVIESRAHTLRLARRLRTIAAAARLPLVFKASFDKANRTGHRGGRGVGLEEGLSVLAEVREATGLPVTTDVHETCQVEAVAAVVDLLQVPAFLCRQTDLVDACARSGKPVSIKKGQFLAPWDCAALVEKFRAAGGRHLILIERGTTFGYNTLVVDMRSLAIMRSLGVPVVFDGTHSVQAPGGRGSSSGGDARFAPLLIRAAMAAGVEGIFAETHDHPEHALCDGPNLIPLRQVPALLADIRAIHRALGRPAPLG